MCTCSALPGGPGRPGLPSCPGKPGSPGIPGIPFAPGGPPKPTNQIKRIVEWPKYMRGLKGPIQFGKNTGQGGTQFTLYKRWSHWYNDHKEKVWEKVIMKKVVVDQHFVKADTPADTGHFFNYRHWLTHFSVQSIIVINGTFLGITWSLFEKNITPSAHRLLVVNCW